MNIKVRPKESSNRTQIEVKPLRRNNDIAQLTQLLREQYEAHELEPYLKDFKGLKSRSKTHLF